MHHSKISYLGCFMDMQVRSPEGLVAQAAESPANRSHRGPGKAGTQGRGFLLIVAQRRIGKHSDTVFRGMARAVATASLLCRRTHLPYIPQWDFRAETKGELDGTGEAAWWVR